MVLTPVVAVPGSILPHVLFLRQLRRRACRAVSVPAPLAAPVLA